jgi:hypothetical protein
MTLETMAFILGALLIAAGVFGGGLEIKELKIPQIRGAARVTSVFVGVVFIALAIAINLKWIGSVQEKTPQGGSVSTFQAPTLDGLRLDACVQWAARCGEEAASAWCKLQGYERAIDYPLENVGERGVSTKLIGTRQVCSEKFCASFAQITCTK